ncbi:decarboxylating NADP(+)-dependent phosphogluconate dehydrogenase [Sanguibacteroides justesenii]|uniref:6-phosphogluconate dehydrogenase, decarboxylating n=1 Tax=Sanguibacteroides justesenii TaxID=1547597 RepID=A0A0C3RDR1_9PORP|nr:decarboxylating NADP(+)-dependent phosphogluconate dehydrogenase [Sanguibacteroides justesenii]KIO42974.1 6-phosphogluconate dehydrogenase [Sanguibacteroides justesenii]
MTQISDIGLIGLAVMGENLALNLEHKGYTVSVYNRIHPGQKSAVARFLEGRGKEKHFVGTYTIQQLVESLRLPRKIMLMVKAGEPVDELIGQLVPYLSPGDVIIDGGNSDFKDTARRVKMLEEKGLYFVGSGISGGEEGALNGPSIMPGGSETAWPLVKDILQTIAAKLDDGSPCCEWIGSGGAGHFVKMVHNGIEYADMQLIAETYSILRRRTGKNNDEIGQIFEEWNRGELNSYLIEITANILHFRDANGQYLLDSILDVAGQKGTGKWSVMSALDEANPLTSVAEAVFTRFMSMRLEEREKASVLYPTEETGDLVTSATINDSGIEAVKEALYAAKLISYSQGFSLMKRASMRYGWDLDFGAIAKIWRKGCIIRSAFLERITRAYHRDSTLDNLLFDTFFQDKIQLTLPALRGVVADGVFNGIALPCFSSALSYFDGLRTLRSPANLIQAQRDYFGAHTYERTDTERGRFFHTDWTGEEGETASGTYNA